MLYVGMGRSASACKFGDGSMTNTEFKAIPWPPTLPKVEPIHGEPFRYFVAASKPTDPPYLVDVEARWPQGRCPCQNYECVRWPAFKQTLLPAWCKHTSAALLFHALRQIRDTSHQLGGDGE